MKYGIHTTVTTESHLVSYMMSNIVSIGTIILKLPEQIRFVELVDFSCLHPTDPTQPNLSIDDDLLPEKIQLILYNYYIKMLIVYNNTIFNLYTLLSKF